MWRKRLRAQEAAAMAYMTSALGFIRLLSIKSKR
jgi:hypothetical protein